MKGFLIGMPKIKRPKSNSIFSKASSRERVPAKKKDAVRERARNTCEFRGCNHKTNLHFHHKNMKADDNRVSNLELICPNHHAVRHTKKIRKVVYEDRMMGVKKTRLTKKTNKKKKAKKENNPFGLNMSKPKWL